MRRGWNGNLMEHIWQKEDKDVTHKLRRGCIYVIRFYCTLCHICICSRISIYFYGAFFNSKRGHVSPLASVCGDACGSYIMRPEHRVN